MHIILQDNDLAGPLFLLKRTQALYFFVNRGSIYFELQLLRDNFSWIAHVSAHNFACRSFKRLGFLSSKFFSCDTHTHTACAAPAWANPHTTPNGTWGSRGADGE